MLVLTDAMRVFTGFSALTVIALGSGAILCATNRSIGKRERRVFLVSIISAVGNAGVPMGCYFLTFSLMTGVGANVAVLGLILPIYTVIDMVETAVNVWSDSCVCAMTNHDLKGKV